MQFYNSLSRRIEPFLPMDPRRVTMYVCGPTVYDTPHLGNARPAVVFDVLFRLLRHHYGEEQVQYARNITDIDDKIMDRAAARGIAINDLTRETTAEYHAVVDALNVLRPTFEPTATDSIADMLVMIALLIDNGHAYIAEDHALFDVGSHPGHGALSQHLQENLGSEHSRIDTASYKRNASDFVLWKPSSSDQPGWDSPFGRGRPGWHIECSAMIRRHLGYTIDIHGGGADLRFPHHDCEMSQSQCAHGVPLAHHWMHNGMLLVDNEKMAKSAGNFTTVRDVLARYPGQVIRLALLSTHYRSPLNWTEDTLVRAKQTLTGWHQTLFGLKGSAEPNEHTEAALAALGSDLNTPQVITEIHAIIKRINSSERSERGSLASAARYLGQIIGLDLSTNKAFLQGAEDWDQVEQLITEREQARSARDFNRADQIRSRLSEQGVVLEDHTGGTTWRRV
jgi:cysteinyl-tRNA synthetase